MKPNFIDRLVGFFNPEAEAARIQSRLKKDLILRGYDAAKDFRTSDWVSASKTSANEEIKAAQKKVRERARDLTRNNPYGVRALNVITANTVGSGIVANVRGPNDKKTEELRRLWKMWAESTACDAHGRHNFYGLQSLVLRTTVESGEGLALRNGFDPETGPKIKVQESDFLNSDQDKDDGTLVQGIEFNSNGTRKAYKLFTKHPGDKGASTQFVSVPAQDVAHIFKQERPGQVRGMPWAHAVIEPLKDFDDYQRATLIGRKIAACFSAFITTNGSDSLLSAEDLKTKREADMSLEPATIRYLNQGESISIATPPPVSGYAEFTRESLRSVAAGLGISYEAMTGDYSQSNYSSSRM
jgi:lambda family phage portal protein